MMPSRIDGASKRGRACPGLGGKERRLLVVGARSCMGVDLQLPHH